MIQREKDVKGHHVTVNYCYQQIEKVISIGQMIVIHLLGKRVQGRV